MTTVEAFEALGIPFEEESGVYTLAYFEDETRRLAQRDDKFQWALTFYSKDTVGMIIMGDMQYLTTFQ